MPLASLANLHWNGPASMAVQLTAGASSVAGLGGVARTQATTTATASIILARATRLRNSPGTASGVATVVVASPKAEGRLGATMNVGAQPSASAIASALWGTSPDGFTSGGDFAEVLKLLLAVARNRVVTDPATGTMRVFADDDTTVLLEGDLWADAAGTTPYAGAGAERRDRLT